MWFPIDPCLNISREEEEDNDNGEKEKHDVWFPKDDQWHCTAVISFLLVLGRSLEQQEKCFFLCVGKAILDKCKNICSLSSIFIITSRDAAVGLQFDVFLGRHFCKKKKPAFLKETMATSTWKWPFKEFLLIRTVTSSWGKKVVSIVA